MPIFGTLAKDGTVTVSWNLQTERLLAPEKMSVDGVLWPQHWVPCSECGILESVPCMVVSFMCACCADGAPGSRTYQLETPAAKVRRETKALFDGD